jgi:DNA modification methylase
MQLLHGDCLELMKTIPDKSVDMVLKPIKGFEHYLISNTGIVYNTRTKSIKKSFPDKKGYLRIRLIDGQRGATKKIHRLVAEAFLPNFKEKPQVNHIDCNKKNNHVSNLEMVNQSENTKHAWKNKRMTLTKKGNGGRFEK